MPHVRSTAVVLFVVAGLVAFVRVAMTLARGNGANVYEAALGVLALVLAYYFAKVLPR